MSILNAFEHLQFGGLDYDEVPLVRSLREYEEEPEKVETIERPLASFDEDGDLEELKLDQVQAEIVNDVTDLLEEELLPVDPTDVPEPVTLLKKQAKEKREYEAWLDQHFPFMTATNIGLKKNEARVAARQKKEPEKPIKDSNNVPVAMGMAAAAVATKRKEDKLPPEELDLDDECFNQEPKPEPEIVEPKKGWFASMREKIGQKVDRAMDSFGRFLDYAVPIASAAAVAATIGVTASTFSKPAAESAQQEVRTTMIAPKPTEYIAVEAAVSPKKSEEMKPVTAAKTLWEKTPDPVLLNDVLTRNHAQIVEVTGGKSANYLHSTASYAHFIKQLSKTPGFTGVLSNPEVQQAKTIAEMINIVERVFGDNVADLIESNAAAMRLSAADIARIS
jgi:hypothetical protein